MSETRSFDDQFDTERAPICRAQGPAQRAELLRNLPQKGVETAAEEKAVDSGKGGVRAIATACSRTAVQLLFRRSGACMSNR